MALAQTGDTRLSALRSAVETFPDSTLCAITFFVELRRQNLPVPRTEPCAQGPIPLQICQFWDDAQPPVEIVRYMESWRETHSDWRYERFDLQSASVYLSAHFPAKVIRSFQKAQDAAMKADIFRLAWLLRNGGYYVDADDRCLASMQTLSSGSERLVLHQEDLGSIGNNFIGCVAGHPAIAQILDAAIEAVLRGDADVVWLSTGPGLVSRQLANFFIRHEFSWENGEVRILDRHELVQVAAIHCQSSYKQSDRDRKSVV